MVALTKCWIPSSIYQLKCAGLMLACAIAMAPRCEELVELVRKELVWLRTDLAARSPEEVLYRLQVMNFVVMLDAGTREYSAGHEHGD